MAIEGPLKELSIHDVCQLLDLSRKTGTLRVTSELRQNSGTVFFEEGVVVGAEIRSNPHPLGRLLYAAGKVTEEELARARGAQAAGDNRRLGEILVSQNAISPRELARHVRQQIEEVVFELMGWSEGYFAFEEGRGGEWPTEAPIRIPTALLLMEAARRVDEWSRIEKKISHLGIVPRLGTEVTPDGPLDLLPTEWEALSIVDGTRTIRDIAATLGRSEFDVAKTLFGLASAGMLVLEDPSRQSTDAPDGDLAMLLGEADTHLTQRDADAAVAVAEVAVSRHPDQPLAYLAYGRALLEAGRYAEAMDALWYTVELDPISASGHRLLGLSLIALGRFHEAAEVWERWRRLGPMAPEESAQLPTVDRLRQAALTIDQALRGSRD
jgi:tetratricopeptide (TPR) repeat protein